MDQLQHCYIYVVVVEVSIGSSQPDSLLNDMFKAFCYTKTVGDTCSSSYTSLHCLVTTPESLKIAPDEWVLDYMSAYLCPQFSHI